MSNSDNSIENQNIDISDSKDDNINNNISNTNDINNNSQKSLLKKAYSGLIANIRGMINKNKENQNIQSSDSNSDENRNNLPVDVVNNNDNNMSNNSLKDKIYQKLINFFEVERNLKTFLILFGIGSFFIVISIFLIPFIITSPVKFSFCFGLGSLLILSSFLFYMGTKPYFTKLFEQKRLRITLCLLISIFIGFVLSFGNHYFLSIICSLSQFLCLIMFVLSFLPGGECGIRAIKSLIFSPFVNVLGSMQN